MKQKQQSSISQFFQTPGPPDAKRKRDKSLTPAGERPRTQARASGASACTPLAINGQNLSVTDKSGTNGRSSTACAAATPLITARSSHVESHTPMPVPPSTVLSDITRSKQSKLQDRLAGDNAVSKKFKETAERFNWQHSPNVTDRKGRKKTDTDYDPRTIRVPQKVMSAFSSSQKQYWEAKSQYMDVILFFKVGTFYELYEDDAQIAHDVLDFKMTVSGVGKCRQVGCPERGLHDAIRKLVNAGYKTGVMEQLETGAEAKKRDPKGIIQRRITSIETPSTQLEPSSDDAIHLLTCHIVARSAPAASQGGGGGGVAFALLNAAESSLKVGFLPEDANHSALSTLLNRSAPTEVLLAASQHDKQVARCLEFNAPDAQVTRAPADDCMEPQAAVAALGGDAGMAGLARGLEAHVEDARRPEVAAAVMLLMKHIKRMHLSEQLNPDVLQVSPLVGKARHMRLDGSAISHLEVLRSSSGSTQGSLLDALGTCSTSGGRRLLRGWLCQPLFDVQHIRRRQQVVQELLEHAELMDSVHSGCCCLPDMDRALGRLRTTLAEPSVALPHKFRHRAQQKRLSAIRSAVTALRQTIEFLREVASRRGALVAAGSAPLLDELCAAVPADDDVACVLVETLFDVVKEAAGAAKGGKKGADVVLQLNEALFPDYDASGEEEERLEAEIPLATEIMASLVEHTSVWDGMSLAVSTLDVLTAFARFAQTTDGPTCMPEFSEAESEFSAVSMWHPALAHSSVATAAIPSDVTIGSPSSAAHAAPALLLTGPNMGGKSTLLRSVSICCILAHVGAPVPAAALRLSPVDAVFTRLGATDRILSGESTFMIECAETAAVLHAASARSLVILDELGRGTSTFDGYAIAGAVLLELLRGARCRMLFATHYHPLTTEFDGDPAVQMGHMGARIERATKEAPFPRVVFLYKLQAGACPKSYGLNVAALAGIAQPICQVAEHVGTALESRLSRNFRQAHRALAAAGNGSGSPAAQGTAADDAAAGEPAAEPVASDDSDVDVSDVALLTPLLRRVFATSGAGGVRGGQANDVQAVWQDSHRLLPALGVM
eukprot:jgi/Ulvmu1/10404/UM061_0088.1